MIDSILPFAVAHIAIGYGLAYTPSSSKQRPFILALIVVCCLISVRSTVAAYVPAHVANEYIIGMMFHASTLLCLANHSPAPNATRSAKNRWVLNLYLDGRWGVTYIPPFSSKDKAYVPSRRRLILQRLWDITWTCGIIYVMQTYRLNMEMDDYGPPHGRTHWGFHDLTARELVVRLYMFIDGYTIPYCGLRAAHSLVSCIALACGDNPASWPPLFGSIAEAYTVRRWYSVFWHHLMRKAFTLHAAFIVNKIFRIPRSRFSRYMVIIFAFLISALLHILSMPDMEECRAIPQVRFYIRIAGAIFLEDLVMWAYKSATGQSPKATVPVTEGGEKTRSAGKETKPSEPDEDAISLLWRLVGYSWVVFFMSWATSLLTYEIWNCY